MDRWKLFAERCWDAPWSTSNPRPALLLTMICAGALGGSVLALFNAPALGRGDAFVWDQIEAGIRFGMAIGFGSGTALLLSRNIFLRAAFAAVCGTVSFSFLSWLEWGTEREAWVSPYELLVAGPITMAAALSAHLARRLNTSAWSVLATVLISGLLGMQSSMAAQLYDQASFLKDFWKDWDNLPILPSLWKQGLVLSWTFLLSVYGLGWFSLTLSLRRRCRWILPGVLGASAFVLGGGWILGEAMPFTPSSDVQMLAFSQDGSFLLSAHEGRTLRVWSIEEAKDQVRVHELRKVRAARASGQRMLFACNGRHVLGVQSTGRCTWWDARTLSLLDQTEYSGAVFHAPVISQDGTCIAAADTRNNIWLWSVIDRQNPFIEDPELVPAEALTVKALRFSADSRLMGAIDDNQRDLLWFLDGMDREETSEPERQQLEEDVFGCAPDQTFLAERRWEEPETIYRLFPKGPLAMSPSGKFIVVSQGKKADVWDWREKRLIATVADFDEWITALAYSPDGRWIAVGNDEGEVFIVSAPSEGTMKRR